MKTYTLEPTKNPDLFRVVDTDRNWEHYFHKPSGRYLRGVTTILERGYAKGAFFQEWLLSKTKQEQQEILAIAGEKGDKVHRWIDLALSADPGVAKYDRTVGVFNRETQQEEPITLDEWSCILSFASFWERHEPIVLISEVPLYSLTNGYAGTGDAIVILTKACDVKTCPCNDLIGKIGLWDWKTSSSIYPSYSAQGASYAVADNIKDHLPKDKKVEYVAILRLGTKHVTTGGYEMKAYAGEVLADALKRFFSAKMIADEGYKPFDPATDIKEIPDQVQISLKAYVAPKPEPAPAVEPVEEKKEPIAKTLKKLDREVAGRKVRKSRKPRVKKEPKQLTIA